MIFSNQTAVICHCFLHFYLLHEVLAKIRQIVEGVLRKAQRAGVVRQSQRGDLSVAGDVVA